MLIQTTQASQVAALDDALVYRPIEHLADGIAFDPNICYTQGMLANAYFFGHPIWGPNYLKRKSKDPFWKERWQHVIPSLDNKIVVDIGCGPGNVYADMGGSPQMVIGVDISQNALKIAQQVGYTPLLADAHNLPLKSHIADIVTLNATLHHCDDMAAVLKEAARLVKPGGWLVTDLDPQCFCWNFKGLGLWVHQFRRKFPLHRLRELSWYRSATEISMRLETEIHNKAPGDGISPQIYGQTLEPLGFSVSVYPHNHDVGQALFTGDLGHLPLSTWLAQTLSGIPTHCPETAQSIMCVAHLD